VAAPLYYFAYNSSDLIALWEVGAARRWKRGMTLQELKQFDGKVVLLRLADGEILKGKLNWYDWEYDDVLVDVLETNQPEHYCDPKAIYTVECGIIESVELCEDSK
jgi:hypothetical protein